MTIEAFDQILEQIKPLTDYICFHVKGEPLLHPEIDRFLDLSYEKGFLVNITTNGTLIKEAADKIRTKPALRQVNFSLHSFEENDSSERKEGFWKDIFFFITLAAAETKLIISLRLWNLDRDGKEADQKNLEMLRKIERDFNLPYSLESKINSTRGIKIAENVFLNQDYQFEWPALDHEEDFHKGFCYGLNTQIAILVDGTVIPCCLDSEGILALGNIHKTPLCEILGGEKAKNIREGFAKKIVVEELCRKCGFRKKFSHE
jgi:radical SAM protein with 4Fe4S-binding SPASM domain